MSIIHNIFTKQPLEISKLNKFISKIDGATYADRCEGVFYFWVDKKSTRGFDITLEQDYIEVRNTVLSNKYDYDLTNKVVKEILALTDGIIINEDDELVTSLPIFDSDRITETEIDDCETIQGFSKENEDITIFGPIRKVHFGKRLHEKFKDLKGEQLKDKIFDLILTVNYQIPNYDYGGVIQIGRSNEDKKRMKLLINEADYIIDKYDYILLQTLGDQPIMITNEILNSMLPSNWRLVDEFTVVAPKTDKNEWNNLLKCAKKYDLWNEFTNK